MLRYPDRYKRHKELVSYFEDFKIHKIKNVL